MVGMVKNILVLCGGKSAEHEVSIMSARNVITALDRKKFCPIVVLVSRSGTWYLSDENDLANIKERSDSQEIAQKSCTLFKKPEHTELLCEDGVKIKIDIVFPLIHGTIGEDGSLQGMLEVMNLPYVGSGVLASAINMDKEISKTLLKNFGITVTDFICVYNAHKIPSYSDICSKFTESIFFVKSAIMGSSVGVYKVCNEKEYLHAIEKAFKYCSKILIEKYIKGREIECAVLGNNLPQASVLGEIKPNHDFYSYEAKYIDPNGANLIVPADLPPHIAKECQEIALLSFKLTGAKGMARVDFFITENEAIILNEINTIPGFTKISMYPKMWQHSGLSYTDLISHLLELALEEFKERSLFITSHEWL